jgi:hypothetical protein
MGEEVPSISYSQALHYLHESRFEILSLLAVQLSQDPKVAEVDEQATCHS